MLRPEALLGAAGSLPRKEAIPAEAEASTKTSEELAPILIRAF